MQLCAYSNCYILELTSPHEGGVILQRSRVAGDDHQARRNPGPRVWCSPKAESKVCFSKRQLGVILSPKQSPSEEHGGNCANHAEIQLAFWICCIICDSPYRTLRRQQGYEPSADKKRGRYDRCGCVLALSDQAFADMVVAGLVTKILL